MLQEAANDTYLIVVKYIFAIYLKVSLITYVTATIQSTLQIPFPCEDLPYTEFIQPSPKNILLTKYLLMDSFILSLTKDEEEPFGIFAKSRCTVVLCKVSLVSISPAYGKDKRPWRMWGSWGQVWKQHLSGPPGEENHKAIHTCRGKGGKGTLAGQPYAQPQTCFCGRKGGQIVLKWLVFYGRWAEHIRSLRKLPAFRFYESSLPTVYSFVVFLLLNEGMGINHL